MSSQTYKIKSSNTLKFHAFICEIHKQFLCENNFYTSAQYVHDVNAFHIVCDSDVRCKTSPEAQGMMGKRSPSLPLPLIGDILLGVMAHSTQVHSCYCKITERLIETNDYNNRTLSRQARGHGSFN